MSSEETAGHQKATRRGQPAPHLSRHEWAFQDWRSGRDRGHVPPLTAEAAPPLHPRLLFGLCAGPGPVEEGALEGVAWQTPPLVGWALSWRAPEGRGRRQSCLAGGCHSRRADRRGGWELLRGEERHRSVRCARGSRLCLPVVEAAAAAQRPPSCPVMPRGWPARSSTTACDCDTCETRMINSSNNKFMAP